MSMWDPYKLNMSQRSILVGEKFTTSHKSSQIQFEETHKYSLIFRRQIKQIITCECYFKVFSLISLQEHFLNKAVSCSSTTLVEWFILYTQRSDHLEITTICRNETIDFKPKFLDAWRLAYNSRLGGSNGGYGIEIFYVFPQLP